MHAGGSIFFFYLGVTSSEKAWGFFFLTQSAALWMAHYFNVQLMLWPWWVYAEPTQSEECEWSFLQVFYIRGQRAYSMSNALFSWDKSVNICPFTTYKNCPIIQWGSLHSSTLNDTAFTSSSSLIAFSFQCLYFLSIFISPFFRVFIFSRLSLCLSGDRSSVHDCHGNNDGKTRWRSHSWPGLLYIEESCSWEHQMLSLKFSKKKKSLKSALKSTKMLKSISCNPHFLIAH